MARRQQSTVCIAIAVCILSLASGSAAARPGAVLDLDSAVSSSGHLRSLKWPLVLPKPFAFPKDIAEAARAAAASGSVDAFAADLCTSWGAKENQGTREFRDVERAKIYPMMLNFARAAHVYGDMVGPLGQVLAKCNSMGGDAADGVGYSLAYVYSKGIIEALAVTEMLEGLYKSGGCKPMAKILDTAAAVVKARDVALDELHLAMQTYSPNIASCTPKDAQQSRKVTLAQGDRSLVKPRAFNAPNHVLPDYGLGASSRSRAGSEEQRPAVALERGPAPAGGR